MINERQKQPGRPTRIDEMQAKPRLTLYHVTSRAAAVVIERDGFDDRGSEVINGKRWFGVWLSNELLWPIEPNDPVAFQIDLPLDAVASYECTMDQGYRRWLIPASIVNKEFRRLIER